MKVISNLLYEYSLFPIINTNLAEIVLLYGSVVLAVTFIVTWSPTFNAVFGLILSVTVSKLFVVYMVPLVLLSWHVILLEQLYEI